MAPSSDNAGSTVGSHADTNRMKSAGDELADLAGSWNSQTLRELHFPAGFKPDASSTFTGDQL
jgi:hypothetical protein